jgi:hypothetical protein
LDKNHSHPVFYEDIDAKLDSKGDAIILSNGFIDTKQGVT